MDGTPFSGCKKIWFFSESLNRAVTIRHFLRIVNSEFFSPIKNESRFIESILYTLKRAETFQLPNYISAWEISETFICAGTLFTEVRNHIYFVSKK